MIVYCDHQSTINLSKNLVHHSWTKHIGIKYHFIRNLVDTKIVYLEYVPTDHQLADLFTKQLDVSQFEYIYSTIGVCDPS